MGRSSNDGGISYHKNYSNNLTGEIVRFINGSGDVFERSINITWILPEISIAYSPNGPHFTSGAVVASISFNKP
ncbi:MAG: hypothetical protein LBH96_00770 [Candidatus Peribacteria bacterium]|jgi:hypothetical protein|nr:hypothetical protein [Candidatus Peribacteria bacterium]